jgi:hypothetical protein
MQSAATHENDWVLAPELRDVERPVSGSRPCCLVVEGVAIHCRVVDLPRVGDRIRSGRPLTIESVRIGGDGMVRLAAAPADAGRG